MWLGAIKLALNAGTDIYKRKQQTRRLFKEISQYVPYLIIVSELAKGIDTVAH